MFETLLSRSAVVWFAHMQKTGTTAGNPRKSKHDLRKSDEHVLAVEIRNVEYRTPSQELAWKELWKTLLNGNDKNTNSNN